MPKKPKSGDPVSDNLKQGSVKNYASGPIFESGPGWGQRLNGWLGVHFTGKILPALAVAMLIWGIAAVTNQKDGQDIVTEDSREQQNGLILEIAQPRDGYVILARRALAQYLTTTGQELSSGQKLFIEETLRQNVETRPIEIGQEVGFAISDIEEAIRKAKEDLTASQLQKWEAWAETVDFDK